MIDFREISDSTLVLITVSFIAVALIGGFRGWYGPGLTSAIASSGLVIATTLSLITTRETLREERLSREQDAKPLLKITLEPVTIGSYSLMIENVGNGPARDVEVTVEAIRTENSNDVQNNSVHSSLPTVAPGEKVALSMGVEGLESPKDRELVPDEEDSSIGPVDDISRGDLKNVKKIVMNGSCRDLLEHEHSVNSEYFTRYLEEGMAQYGGSDIAEELEGIGKSLSSIQDSVDRHLR